MAQDNAHRVRLVFAFAAVYLIWGSTYLGIKVAIETLPPFLMAAARFLTAGALLYAWSRWRGAERPQRVHWRSAAVAGGLLLLCGNGGVVWAEQRVATGLAALLVASEPLWVSVVDWLRPGGVRPTGRVVVGLLIGLAGLGILIGPESVLGGEAVDLLGAGAVLLAAVAWAVGSIYSRQARLPAAPSLATSMQMLAGGGLLLCASLFTGEAARFDPAAVSTASLLAFAYLTVFGSLVAFTAYVWLLRVVSPVMAATYAYVNPVVAVLLGWLFAGEPLTLRTLVAAAVIIAGVIVLTVRNKEAAVDERGKTRRPLAPSAPPQRRASSGRVTPGAPVAAVE